MSIIKGAVIDNKYIWTDINNIPLFVDPLKVFNESFGIVDKCVDHTVLSKEELDRINTVKRDITNGIIKYL